MPSAERQSDKFEKLRSQAEALIRKQPPAAATEVSTEMLDLIHELKIHQAELEIQNEALGNAQEEIAALHREYEDLYEFAPCGYLTLNEKGIITRANLTAIRLLGVDRHILLQSSFSRHIEGAWKNVFFTARQASGATGEKQRIELPLKTGRGKPLWVSVDIEAERDGLGEVRQWRMVMLDIADRKQAEAEKEKLQARLAQIHKMEAIGTLSGGVAHEFNNILSIIIGNLELAMDDLPQQHPVHDRMKEIHIASLRAKDVVRQILSYARKTPDVRKPTDVCALVEESLRLVRATIPASIDLRQEVLCDSAMIYANPTEINQIILNLCNNAVYAAVEETGIVTVRLTLSALDDRQASEYEDLHRGEYAKLTVTDTGSGIDPVTMKKIFDPFFTTKEVNEGMGMGLPVVHGLVKKHDGAIRIFSEPGKGTTVEVLFPLTRDSNETEVAYSEDFPSGTGRILFVDDEPALVELAKELLARKGYNVTATTSSMEALRRYQENPHHFDLIITDLAMPEMPGDRLVREIKKITPHIPIILCTGHSPRITQEEALAQGVTDYLMKPLRQTDLIRAVQKALNPDSASS